MALWITARLSQLIDMIKGCRKRCLLLFKTDLKPPKY